MKKTKLFPFLRKCVMGLMILSSLQSFAQGSSFQKKFESRRQTEKFGVNVEPLWLVLGGIGGKAEYFVTDKVSVGLGGVYIPSHKIEGSSSDETANSIGGNYSFEHNEIVLGSNIMLTGTLQSDGFYLNPGVGYQYTAITHFSFLDLSGSVSSPFARLTAGYQWVTSGNFRVGLGAGVAAYQDTDVVIADNSGREIDRTKSSTMSGLALDLHLGYIF